MDFIHAAMLVEFDFDDLPPLSKIQALTSSSQALKDESDLLVMALVAVDLELKEVFHLRGNALYVLSDNSIKTLVFQALNRAISPQPFITLTLSQLIYRFTVATKFEVADPVEKQLRINSWGVRYYNEVLSLHHAASMASLRRAFRNIVHRSEADYAELIKLLQIQEVDSSTAKKIQSINRNLTFRLVA